MTFFKELAKEISLYEIYLSFDTLTNKRRKKNHFEEDIRGQLTELVKVAQPSGGSMLTGCPAIHHWKVGGQECRIYGLNIGENNWVVRYVQKHAQHQGDYDRIHAILNKQLNSNDLQKIISIL